MASSIAKAQLTRTEPFTEEFLTVNVNGLVATLGRGVGEGEYGAGSSVTMDNPIGIVREDNANWVYVFSPSGSYPVLIQEDTRTVEVSDCFVMAVQKVLDEIL